MDDIELEEWQCKRRAREPIEPAIHWLLDWEYTRLSETVARLIAGGANGDGLRKLGAMMPPRTDPSGSRGSPRHADWLAREKDPVLTVEQLTDADPLRIFLGLMRRNEAKTIRRELDYIIASEPKVPDPRSCYVRLADSMDKVRPEDSIPFTERTVCSTLISFVEDLPDLHPDTLNAIGHARRDESGHLEALRIIDTLTCKQQGILRYEMMVSMSNLRTFEKCGDVIDNAYYDSLNQCDDLILQSTRSKLVTLATRLLEAHEELHSTYVAPWDELAKIEENVGAVHRILVAEPRERGLQYDLDRAKEEAVKAVQCSAEILSKVRPQPTVIRMCETCCGEEHLEDVDPRANELTLTDPDVERPSIEPSTAPADYLAQSPTTVNR